MIGEYPPPPQTACHSPASASATESPQTAKAPGRGFPFALPRSRCEGGPARNAQPAPRAQEKRGPSGPLGAGSALRERDVLPSRGRGRSTLGDGGLSFRVRNGTGRSPPPWSRSRRGARRLARLRRRARARAPPWRPHSEHRTGGPPHAGHAMRRARAISGARLSASPRLHLRPYRPPRLGGPLPKRELISEAASHLDAFSGYPRRT